MATLAVLGATGATGRHVVDQALAGGDAVRALARGGPARLSVEDPALTVVDGDARSALDVRAVLEGTDAVLVALGAAKPAPADIFTTALRHVAATMRHAGPRRLVVLLSAGVLNADGGDGLPDRFLARMLRLTVGDYIRDAQSAYEWLVREADDLDWTVVRPGRLTDGTLRGSVRHGTDLSVGPRPISRADVASFMLAQVDDTTYVRQAPRIRG